MLRDFVRGCGHVFSCWVEAKTCNFLPLIRPQPRGISAANICKASLCAATFLFVGKNMFDGCFFLGGGGRCSNAGYPLGENIIFIAKLRINSETDFRFIWWTRNLLAWLCQIGPNYHEDIIFVAKITKTFGKWLSLHMMEIYWHDWLLKGREARRFCVNRRRRFVVRSRGRFSVAVASLVRSPDWPIQFLLLQPVSAASKPPWSARRGAGTVSGLWGGEFRRLLSKTRADSEPGNPTLLQENNVTNIQEDT